MHVCYIGMECVLCAVLHIGNLNFAVNSAEITVNASSLLFLICIHFFIFLTTHLVQ
jgi:hypothetical protein